MRKNTLHTNLSRKLLKLSWITGTLLSLICLSSCRSPVPYTKDKYLQQFQSFSRHIQQKCRQFQAEDFRTLDGTYLALSRDLYDEFYDQLSRNEKALIWQYRVQYISCRASHKLEDTGKKIYLYLEDRLMD